MNPSAVIQQFQQLPAEAQRVVAKLIELLSKQSASSPAVNPPTEGAIMLPPLAPSNVPMTWPENEFMDPEFYGAWADRTDIADSTEYVRELRHKHWSRKS